MSGLELSIPKTVVILLWPNELDALRKALALAMPLWENVFVAYSGAYFCFAASPEKQD